MPEGSLRRGAPARGPPKHQNKFAFKHNKNSKKTKLIKKIAHDGLCKRCYEKIEWRKKYRKYKPLTAPAICNGCHQRTVKRAYHTLCDSCAGGRGVCAKCAVKLEEEEAQGQSTTTSGAAGATAASQKKKESAESTDEDAMLDSDDEEGSGIASSANRKAADIDAEMSLDEDDEDDDDDEEEED